MAGGLGKVCGAWCASHETQPFRVPPFNLTIHPPPLTHSLVPRHPLHLPCRHGQDAHEFLNYLLNEMAERLEKAQKAREAADPKAQSPPKAATSASGAGGNTGEAEGEEGEEGESAKVEYQCKTWIHSIFEGVLTNETRCLTCESVTSRDESFLDLSLEIEQDSSVRAAHVARGGRAASSRPQLTRCSVRFPLTAVECMHAQFLCVRILTRRQ